MSLTMAINILLLLLLKMFFFPGLLIGWKWWEEQWRGQSRMVTPGKLVRGWTRNGWQCVLSLNSLLTWLILPFDFCFVLIIVRNYSLDDSWVSSFAGFWRNSLMGWLFDSLQLLLIMDGSTPGFFLINKLYICSPGTLYACVCIYIYIYM